MIFQGVVLASVLVNEIEDSGTELSDIAEVEEEEAGSDMDRVESQAVNHVDSDKTPVVTPVHVPAQVSKVL